MGSSLIKKELEFTLRKEMKLGLNISLFLFALFFFGDKSFSLSDYQIKKICKKEKKENNNRDKYNNNFIFS